MLQCHHWAGSGVSAVRGTADHWLSPWHTHGHVVVGLVDSGLMTLESRFARHLVEPGHGYVLPANLAHRCGAEGSVKYRILCFDCTLGGNVSLPANTAWKNAFEVAFEKAKAEENSGENDGSAILSLIEMATVGTDDGQYLRDPLSACQEVPAAVRQALGKLRQDPSIHLSLADLAMDAKCSPFHLQRIFTKWVGLSPTELQSVERLRVCRAALGSALPLTDIAYACGFADQSHMIRSFHRFMGTTPSRYRREASLTDRQ